MWKQGDQVGFAVLLGGDSGLPEGAGSDWNEADRLRICFAGRYDLTLMQHFLYHLQ